MTFTINSPGNSSDEKVRTCVENVLDNNVKSETQKLYEDLVKLIGEECEKLLKNINEEDNKEKGIKEVVQGRTKKYES